MEWIVSTLMHKEANEQEMALPVDTFKKTFHNHGHVKIQDIMLS